MNSQLVIMCLQIEVSLREYLLRCKLIYRVFNSVDLVTARVTLNGWADKEINILFNETQF